MMHGEISIGYINPFPKNMDTLIDYIPNWLAGTKVLE